MLSVDVECGMIAYGNVKCGMWNVELSASLMKNSFNTQHCGSAATIQHSTLNICYTLLFSGNITEGRKVFASSKSMRA